MLIVFVLGETAVGDCVPTSQESSTFSMAAASSPASIPKKQIFYRDMEKYDFITNYEEINEARCKMKEA